ncbi:MAG TPA: BON domain-containing protein [Ramlibacter sp.]|nr:BON domain-containing protein [Ramlibacter sp.]
MKTIHLNAPKSLATAASLAVLLALGACDRTDERTAGQRMDSAVSQTRQAGAEVKRDAQDATASAGAAVRNAAEDTKAMGAAAADKIDDASITAKVNAGLSTDKDLSAIRIDVDTQSGVVTLSGPAPSATAKERASEIARAVKGVTSVNNQLTVKAG